MNWPSNPISQMLQQDSRVLRAARVCAVHRPRADLVVTICVEESTCVCRRLHAPEWECPRDIEEWCEPLGWTLGSSWLTREFWAATRTPNVVTLLDFGFDAYFPCLDAGDECPDLLAEAVAGGYWKWTFQPRWPVHDRAITDMPDDTLDGDGGRERPFPGWRPTYWTDVAKRFETLAPVEPWNYIATLYSYCALQVEQGSPLAH